MNLTWTPKAWEGYLYWQGQDAKKWKRINELIKDAMRHPDSGLGRPERLQGNLSGCWSRRIDKEHRLIYTIKEDAFIVLQCRYHY